MMGFDQFQSKDFTTNKKSELQLYLEESRVDRDSELDVLAFWKVNEFRYPILARMARDFLTIPVSTVASESTFSASGRVLNEHRSSLSKDTVEALICTKDWLFGDFCSNQVLSCLIVFSRYKQVPLIAATVEVFTQPQSRIWRRPWQKMKTWVDGGGGP
ncbi:hypothetical protein L1987_14622 [Smallanthus sonchifolius]|uniref:Uncharacterized protein n=1 Tax=Smallanthus sonchifolius TaxID=185202 RepID=A0ACB9J3F2_9ASTR|nr:hypothetical protein L1987_14622 [Smallanthus sonchifolius]